MKKVLESEIQTGQFAREFILEKQSGNAGFTAIRRLGSRTPNRNSW